MSSIRHPPWISSTVRLYSIVQCDAMSYINLRIELTVDNHNRTLDIFDAINVGEDIQTRQSTARRKNAHTRHERRVQHQPTNILALGGNITAWSATNRLTVHHDITLIAACNLLNSVLIHHLDITVRIGLKGDTATGSISRIIIHDNIDVAATRQNRRDEMHSTNVCGVAVTVDDSLCPISQLVPANTINDGGNICARLFLWPNLNSLYSSREPWRFGQPRIWLKAIPHLGRGISSIPRITSLGPLAQLEITLG
mmetsp:Transcript_35020/g.75879  ORF Transcript_35020/g.75879 Transcript_35020/m.75879 type:complete len:254 (+) Transcript_35020:278-1039(+)